MLLWFLKCAQSCEQKDWWSSKFETKLPVSLNVRSMMIPQCFVRLISSHAMLWVAVRTSRTYMKTYEELQNKWTSFLLSHTSQWAFFSIIGCVLILHWPTFRALPSQIFRSVGYYGPILEWTPNLHPVPHHTSESPFLSLSPLQLYDTDLKAINLNDDFRDSRESAWLTDWLSEGPFGRRGEGEREREST